MKKIYAAIFVFSLVSLSLYAQDDATIPGKSSSSSKEKTTPSGYISLRLGPSIPTGDFGSSDLENEEAGFATIGFDVSLNAGYTFYEGFGAAFTWLGNANYIDEDELGITLDSSPWTVGAISIGPMYMGSVDRFIYQAHMLFGNAVVYNPDLGGNLEEDNASSFAFTLGFGGKFLISNRIFLSGTLDIFSTNPNFEVLGFEQSISMIMLNGGLGFTLP